MNLREIEGTRESDKCLELFSWSSGPRRRCSCRPRTIGHRCRRCFMSCCGLLRNSHRLPLLTRWIPPLRLCCPRCHFFGSSLKVKVIMSTAVAPAQVRAFSILGDSNVHRLVNKTNCRANQQLKNSQVRVPFMVLKAFCQRIYSYLQFHLIVLV